ncbi:acriflavin resistance protein [Paludibacter propionicigenes WB4]|uniref:Acriflavin resistance protein n=1 Tax=Paludibacter propionicigenes (strain DSM 17365 / JCM 13257 / WB4) TaxID=694427 RepID=E4T4Q6_PALPW|nr:efflux RND transporter permease subunit [Paludibacter propionicigenes]ADQ79700.1 acriflavin resistance protein [Paludibacter propionicigenes WB4]
MNRKLPISSFSTILVFVCLTIVGMALMPYLPVKLSPSKALPSISISFSLAGQSSKVVETEVTSKLEAMLSRLEGIQDISSTSGNGWGRITINLDKHVDINVARFEVATIIRQTRPSLPPQTSYPNISVSKSDENSDRPFISYTINAPENLTHIYALTDKLIKPKLANIKGIDRIDISGSTPMEYRLEYDAKQLEALGITISNIKQSINNYLSKEFLGNGSVEQVTGQKALIRVLLMTNNEDNKPRFNCSGITVKTQSGGLINLSRIVKINYQQAESQYIYRINGLNSIYLSIVAKPTANQLSLSETIKQQINKIQSVLPKGYEIHVSYDATEYIREELSKIYFRSGLTVFILLLFVLLVYRNLKYLLLIVSSLIINLSIAVIVYYLLKLEIHLYSLAGITISMTLIIDNVIIMSDQIMRRKNMYVFLAIVAGTLTTIGSLSMIFLMDDKIKLNLQDFAFALITNLIISLFVVLFVVPVLLDLFKINDLNRPRRKIGLFKRIRWNRVSIWINRFYAKYCQFACRWKYILITLLILSFGLPVFMLPDKLEGNEKWKETYNKTFGSEFYKETIKPIADNVLGGTLRLFVQKVYEGSYFTDRQETSLYVTATLPNGSTIVQMNYLIQQMEAYLSQFKQIKQFQTTIESARRANITILFNKEDQYSGFPNSLKSNLITKALEMGGGSWGVYGLGDGFSNDVSENAGSYQAELYGYNYDELNAWAKKFKAKLLNYRRIKEVSINSEFSWYKDDYQEFEFNLDKKILTETGISPIQLFGSLNNSMGKSVYAGEVSSNSGQEQIYLDAKQSANYDIWNLIHTPMNIGEKEVKLSQVAQIEKGQSPQNIYKENQQYRLCVQYEYIGASEQGQKVLEKAVNSFKKQLPMGYTIENKSGRNYNWGNDTGKQYGLLFLILIIIFFLSSILFNSLKQPFAILFVIPFSFIGIFLTFYLFKLNFDQGGFASFILLSGLTVNANIYIIDEFNRIVKQKRVSKLRAYVKAWSYKMRPIMLTITSTVLGFSPFIIGSTKEAFWYPLAAGTMGGLLFSIIGIIIFLPIFLNVSRK